MTGDCLTVRLEQVHAVVLAEGGRALVVQGVEDAARVCLADQIGHVPGGGPAGGCCLVGCAQVASGDPAAEDQAVIPRVTHVLSDIERAAVDAAADALFG